jgi:hypothetical protein
MGGTGIIYRSKMAYDTGSTNLTIFVDELNLLQFPLFPLPTTVVQTAGRIINTWQLALELRVITDDHQLVLRDWHNQMAVITVRSSPAATRLSSKSLNGQFFVCERPSDRRLFVARHKTPLNKMM